MSRLQALREQKANLAKTIRQTADRLTADGYTETADDKAGWEKLNADYNATCRGVDLLESADRLEAASASATATTDRRITTQVTDDGRQTGGTVAAVTERHRACAIAGWLSAYTPRGLNQEQTDACRAVGFNPFSKELAVSLYATDDYQHLQSRWRQSHPSQAMDRVRDFKATLSGGAGPSGGYLIAPEQLRHQLEINMLAYGGMRQVAETIRTATGELMSWPTVDDTTNTGVQLGESVAIGASVDPSFGKVLWSAYKYSSKPVLVPYELIQDNVFNLPSVLGGMLGERLGRITNTKYTVGSGAATAKGIVTASATFAATSATAIAFDDVLNLIHSVDPAYRNGAGFMLHDQIMLALRKLKDGLGQYLWRPGMSDGVPDQLAGYGLTVNQDMDATMASGKKTLLYGQLNKYKIRTVGEVRMYRLEERYRDTDQDAFLALIREDGNLLTAGTAPVKVLTH